MYAPQAHLQSAVRALHALQPAFSLSWEHAIPENWSEQCAAFLDPDMSGEATVCDIRDGVLQTASDKGSAIATFLAEAIRPWDDDLDPFVCIKALEEIASKEGIWQAHYLLAELHASVIEGQLERGDLFARADTFFDLADMYVRVVQHCSLYRANSQRPRITFDGDYQTANKRDIGAIAKAYAYASCPDNPNGSGRAAIYLLMCALDAGAPRVEAERQLDLLSSTNVLSGTIKWRALMDDRQTRYRLLESLGYHVEDIVEQLRDR